MRNARWRRLQDLAKCGIVDVSIDGAASIKLRVIEGIERFEAEFERLAFAQLGDLVKGHVPIINAGSVERPACRVSLRAERIRTEQRGVEVGLSVSRVVIDFQVSGSNVGTIDAHGVDAVVLCVYEKIVAIASESYGQTRRKATDPRNCPPLS